MQNGRSSYLRNKNTQMCLDLQFVSTHLWRITIFASLIAFGINRVWGQFQINSESKPNSKLYSLKKIGISFYFVNGVEMELTPNLV